MGIQDENSRKVLILNDETAVLKFIIYNKNQNDLPAYYINCNPVENMYVKVVLTITHYQDKKIFICQRMDEIKNFNEYVNHIIMVIHKKCLRDCPDLDSEEKENHLPVQNKNVGY